MADKYKAGVKPELDSSDIPKMVANQISKAKSAHNRFVDVANQGDNFFAGHQWDAEDEAYLREQQRPVVTFNRIMKTLLLIMGTEIAHRQEALVISRSPNKPGQKRLVEMATRIIRWVLDKSEGDEERSTAFFDAIRRGVGWLELSMNYIDDPDGKIDYKRVDGLEMWVDPTSKEPNFADAHWICRRRFMSYEELCMMFGDEAVQNIPTSKIDPEDQPDYVENISPIPYDPGSKFSAGSSAHAYGKYLVNQFQWWEWEEYYRMPDPDDPNKIISVSKENLPRIKRAHDAKGNPNPKMAKQYRKKFRQTWVCNGEELETITLPIPAFTFLAMTGLWDNKERVFFGIVRPMVPPQQWTNKWYSSMIENYARGRKNGIVIEETAVSDARQFEEMINGPGGVATVREGKIGAFKELQTSNMPSALPYLLEHSLKSISDVPGINVELLGASEGDQPGVTTRYRQTQGLTVLAPFFNAERRLRLKETRLILEYARRYLADGRVLTIGEKEDIQVLPIFRQELAEDYDIILDENPKNPNTKMEVWTEFLPFLQMALKMQMFGVLSKMMDYSPFPAGVVEEIKKEFEMLQQQMQMAAQNPQMAAGLPGMGGGRGRGTPPNPQLDQAKIEKMKSGMMVDIARAKAIEAATKLKAFAVGSEAASKGRKIGMDEMLMRHELARKQQNMRHAEAEHQQNTRHAEVEHHVDQATKIVDALKTEDEPRVQTS